MKIPSWPEPPGTQRKDPQKDFFFLIRFIYFHFSNFKTYIVSSVNFHFWKWKWQCLAIPNLCSLLGYAQLPPVIDECGGGEEIYPQVTLRPGDGWPLGGLGRTDGSSAPETPSPGGGGKMKEGTIGMQHTQRSEDRGNPNVRLYLVCECSKINPEMIDMRILVNLFTLCIGTHQVTWLQSDLRLQYNLMKLICLSGRRLSRKECCPPSHLITALHSAQVSSYYWE